MTSAVPKLELMVSITGPYTESRCYMQRVANAATLTFILLVTTDCYCSHSPYDQNLLVTHTIQSVPRVIALLLCICMLKLYHAALFDCPRSYSCSLHVLDSCPTLLACPMLAKRHRHQCPGAITCFSGSSEAPISSKQIELHINQQEGVDHERSL